MRAKMRAAAVVTIAGLLAAACTSKAPGGTSGGNAAPVKVGFVYSKTGLLSLYTPAYLAGFKAGLDYATKGTGNAGQHKIEIDYADDAGDPAKAVAAAKTFIGQGDSIIMGTEDSGIALQLAPLAAQNHVLYISGAAATDKITGINKYTFRSGRQSYQDVATAGTFLGNPQGKRVLVFAQDTAFGQGNVAAVKAVLGTKGAAVSQLLVPASATDLTPFALKVKQAKPDLVFAAWAGTTTAAMWQTLDQQGVFDATTVTTGLGNVGSYSAYGPVANKISFLGHYFAGAADNAVNTAMIAAIKTAGATPDIFSPDGFVAAQLLVHAVEQGGTDVDSMIKALGGWSFAAPKGQETVRSADHAMLQPMFQVKLVERGANWVPQRVKTIPADVTAPPSGS